MEPIIIRCDCSPTIQCGTYQQNRKRVGWGHPRLPAGMNDDGELIEEAVV